MLRSLLANETKARFILSFSRQRCSGIKKTTRFLTTLDSQQPKVGKETESSSSKSWRDNPNLKYWVIGISLIGGVIFHYVYRDREKKRLILKNLPAIPNHPIQPRQKEVSELKNLQKLLKRDNDMVLIQIVGSKGAGKTQLASLLAQEIAKEEQGKFQLLPRNHFTGYINARSLDTMLLDVKMFCIAMGCQDSDWSSKSVRGSNFLELSKQDQLNCFTEAMKDKLRENSGWVVIIDDLSREVNLDSWLSDGIESSWGKGTIITTSEHMMQKYLKKESIYQLEKGMNTPDAADLLIRTSGVPDESRQQVEKVVEKLERMPLAIVAAGYYLKQMKQEACDYSYADLMHDINEAFDIFNSVNESSLNQISKQLAPSYVSISMATRKAVSSNSHLLHMFDLIGSCSPDWPLPTTLLSFYLTNPEFNLAPLKGRVLDSLTGKETRNQDESTGKANPDEEVEEVVLSIKRMAKALEKFTTAVKENYNAIKIMFYPPDVELPSLSMGASELLKECPLLALTKVCPGDVEAVAVHPIVHSVFRQTFTAVTASHLEKKFLEQAQSRYNNSSWFRRLQAFNPQRILQEHRNSLGENPSSASILSANRSNGQSNQINKEDPDLQKLLKNDSGDKDDFRTIRPLDMVRHCQEHTARVLKTIKKEAAICGQDSKTRTVAKLLVPHLAYILATNTTGSLGPKTRAQALLASSSIDSTLGNLAGSKLLLEEALDIEKQQFGELSIETAETLTRLGDVYNSLDNVQKGRELLEKALQIYETLRKNHGEYKNKLGFARTLISLGLLYGELGFKETSKDYLERGFSYMQAGAPPNPDELESRRFAQDISTTLTDVGHAYLSVGQILQGKKLLDLALMGHKNLHGDDHPEVARTLTVLSIAYSMQGNSQESRKMRNEAGKIQAKLGASPVL